jgi:hypothetical protein
VLKQNITRSLTILFALFVGVLFSGCTGQEKPTMPSEENVVEVIVGDQPLPVPEGFKKTLQGLDIANIVLVNNRGQLQAITIEGAPLDLCRSGTEGKKGGRTCKLGITTGGLASELSGIETLAGCGRCTAGNKLWECNKSTNRYYCATGEYSCSTACQ